MRRTLLCLSLLVAAPALAAPTAKEVKDCREMVDTMASNQLDEDMMTRLLVQACSETPSCAQGADKELEAVASVDGEQRIMILVAAESLDYKAQRDKGTKLTPLQWIKKRWKPVLDQVGKVLPKPEKKSYDAGRKKLGI